MIKMHVESTNNEQIKSLQERVASLEWELNYWQNTTIDILKKYLLENNGKNDSISILITLECTTAFFSRIRTKPLHCFRLQLHQG